VKLYDPGTLKTFLTQHGITASKGLGQHFLCSRSAVESIVGATEGCSGILEIGPGPGVLTSPLSESSESMIALELDDRMIAALKDSAPKAEVLKLDALQADLPKLLSGLPEPRAIVSNLPYYITGPLVTRIAEARDHYSLAVLMMQKEVAHRIMAKAGNRNRGSLSVYLQSLFEISLVCHVAPSAFVPPPKVESTVLKFIPKELNVPIELQGKYFHLVRCSFAQPRKTLANNLVAAYRVDRETISSRIESVNLDEMIRPHDVPQEAWKLLAVAMADLILQ